MNSNEKQIIRDFKLTSLALKNKNTIFLVLFVIAVFGMLSYQSLPKELFPEVSFPTILVQTTYPGNSPSDIENLITRPVEKEVQSIRGLNELTSISAQDASMVFVEFNENMKIKDALADVKDAVDKAKSELPDDLLFDPIVMDIDFSEFPIININLSGDYSIDELREYAEFLEDEIEDIYEISKVEIKGINDREVEININPHKLEAYNLSFRDIENAVASENVSMSGGDIKMGDFRRSIRIVGEFKKAKDMEDIIVKHEKGNIVYMRDVIQGNIRNTYTEPTSFARLNKKSVVSLQVVKKSGENLLAAADQIFAVLKKARKDKHIPEDLTITITNDQSKNIRWQLSNLENSMLISMIFVISVLFFFLGLRNALFVGLAIPLSMFLSFLVLGVMGQPINMIVLFSLILALGMLVDNAIVVVENIYRFLDQGYPLMRACREAVGEIALPIITSTATTLAAFVPLAFWGGMVGQFMKILPIMLIIVLTSSLFVALVLLPVLASVFIKKDEHKKPDKKKNLIVAGSMIVLAAILYFGNAMTFANLLIIISVLILLNLFLLFDLAQWFQNKLLVKLENFYLRVIQFILKNNHPYAFLFGTFVLMFVTIGLFVAKQPKVVFFPVNEPQYINIIAEYPVGTDVTASDSLTKIIEDDVFNYLKPHDKIIESILTTVGEGVTRDNEFSVGKTSNKARITIKFVDYEYRKKVLTSAIMKDLSDHLSNQYPGVDIFVEKNKMGPPTGNPINIEISGKDLKKLYFLSDSILNEIEMKNIPGIENLKMDLETGKPELQVTIDRERARRFGLSTYQIASTIRTALFGKEISDYKEGEDEYPIQLRFAKKYRYNVASLMNQRITFRNNRGKLLQVPISAVASFKYGSSFGTINRKEMDRVITLFSNVIEGYNANEINNELKALMTEMKMPDGYEYNFTGEQAEQQKNAAFLAKALLLAISFILIILVTQFNSVAKPIIIIFSVIFSTIGVFGGLATFDMDFVVVMTGVGIISLAGVVVNNAIVLIDYIDYLKLNRKKELEMDEEDNLPINEIIPCIVDAGKTRLRPVLLTAITTILGLLPMALGMNIDFAGLLTNLNPNIYFGGDNALFWGPMAWTVVFGLTFATFLTLIIVPVMYVLANKLKLWSAARHANKNQAT